MGTPKSSDIVSIWRLESKFIGFFHHSKEKQMTVLHSFAMFNGKANGFVALPILRSSNILHYVGCISPKFVVFSTHKRSAQL